MKRHLYQSEHPFDAYPFEAMCCGSWQAVEKIRIRDGTLTFHLVDDQFMVLERGPFSNLRIRSRKATLSDCTCFLRPGIDICALSTSQETDNSDGQDSKPVWADAKISSIERKPHESRCSCQFYVSFYTSHKPLGSERGTLGKETRVIGIDQISILQKLQKHSCDSQYYRWDFSRDCSLLPKTKLLLGKFLSDISWLLVTSVIKQTAFDVRSVENKIVYEILEADLDNISINTNNYVNAVNFKVEDEVLVPQVLQLAQVKSIEAAPVSSTCEAERSSLSGLTDLRRSKRRNVRPDRFLGCDSIDESDIDYGRMRPIYKVEKWQDIEDDDEMSLPLSCLFRKLKKSSSREHTEEGRKFGSYEISSNDDLLVWKHNSEGSREMKLGLTNEREDHQLAIVPLPEEGNPIAFHHYPHYHLDDKSSGDCTRQITEVSPKYYHVNNTRKVQRKNVPDLEDMAFARKWEGVSSNSNVQRARHHSITSRVDGNCEERVYKKRSLSAGAYKDLINSFLKNLDSTIKKEEPQIIDQWKEFKAKSCLDQRNNETEEPCQKEEEEENSETEMLWREMELSLASSYLDEDNEGFNAGVSTDTMQNSWDQCQHEYKLDEEIGMVCPICGSVSTEIKDVSPPFMQYTIWSTEDKCFPEGDAEQNPDEEADMDLSCNYASLDMPSSEENENVWALIPELKRKLHLHQKKAFEFLWKNVAGSTVPALMKPVSRNIGGCVVSHTPGAGKTFLIIAFLVSYLKLFPGKRPLVLAPKTTLYTWYKEFIKWEVPVPVHLIHGRRTYRVFRPKNVTFPGHERPTDDVMHILDCLEKIQKWHAHPSVLVMGYTSFLTLMREDSKFAHRKFMAKVLRESPGILVLDEGHNPRSTKSRLRKCLMKVGTDLRILLSGTLFQNNFCEYFNTLCLARPKFVNEVLKALDPKFKRKRKRVKKAWHLQESRARKFFLDKIAKKIDAGEGEERMEGLNMLRKMTSRFIDVYEGGSSESLPGLQIYTLLMNSTDIQKEILDKLHYIMERYNGYPLELELLITLGSIHPWLVKTAVCANKFFTQEQLRNLEKYKFDLKKGSKVRFVMNLIHHIVKKEKVLLFCHNIAPVKLFLELFETFFRWRRGREVLVLTGDLELFERGKVMDMFEEPGGASRVLLASITACAEGISLTAASRVILLDSEWNPSKTKQAIARAFRPGQQKVVYVYQLLATGTLEEDKYRRTTWKEWVSSMIFSEAFVEDPSRWQAEKIEDDVLREMVEEDRYKSFHMIMKNEKASTMLRDKD